MTSFLYMYMYVFCSDCRAVAVPSGVPLHCAPAVSTEEGHPLVLHPSAQLQHSGRENPPNYIHVVLQLAQCSCVMQQV